MISNIECSKCAASINEVANLTDGKARCPSCGAIQADTQPAALNLSSLSRANVIALSAGVACLIFGISAFVFGEFTIRGSKSMGVSGGGTYRLGTSASNWFGVSMLSFALLCFFVYWAARREWYLLAQYPKWARNIVILLALLAGTGMLGAIILQGDPLVWGVSVIPGLLFIQPAMSVAAKIWHRLRRR